MTWWTELIDLEQNRGGRQPLVAEQDTEEGAVHLQTVVVIDKTQFPESVHEKIDSGTGRTNHFGQGFLTDFGDHSFLRTLLAKMSKQ